MALITLVEYARRVGRAPNTCRKKAEIGTINAIKMGRDWFIDEDEEYRDARHNKSKDNPIANIRREQGITQSELSKMVGCHKEYLSAIERGDRKPSEALLFRIAEALGKKVEDIQL